MVEHPKAPGHPSRSRSAFARPLELRKKSHDDRPAKVGTERRRRVNSWIGRAGLVSGGQGLRAASSVRGDRARQSAGSDAVAA
jgi:hypothetical protein